MSPWMSSGSRFKSRLSSRWIAIGAGAGIVFGMALGDPGMGLVLGAAGGVLVGAISRKS